MLLAMSKGRSFYVYIMTNRQRSHTLYAGVSGNLPLRVFQHKHKLVQGFTSKYNLTRLVYYELFYFPDRAIAREKEIKGWKRFKKIRLIESMNPNWDDLAAGWEDVNKPQTQSESTAREVLRSPSPKNAASGRSG